MGIPSWNELKANSFLLSWNASAIGTVLLPLLIMTVSRLVHSNAEEGSGDNNNDNNQDNVGFWYRWFHRNDNNQDGEQEQGDQEQDNEIPWWWWGGRNGSVDPEMEGKGSLIFVYMYTLGLFIFLTLYGNYVFRRGSDYGPFQGAMIMFINMALVILVLLAGLDAIETEGGPELEEDGWYGQFSVCIFLTCLLWMVHGIVFVYWLRQRILAAHANNNNTSSPNSPGMYFHWGGTEEAQKRPSTGWGMADV